MGTGKEWLTKIEKTKSFPTSEELRAQKVSPLTATSWVDAFARTIAHEASEELILSDRLRQRLEANANARSIRYPKTTSKISEKNGTQLKKHSGNSVSSMYNKVVSSEVSPKEVEIVFRYPTLGIDFTGRLTRDKIGTELIPKVIAALIQSGMDTEEVRKIIEKSLTPLVQSTEPILKITMRVQVILNNIVQRIAQPIKTEPAKSSIEPVPAIPAKASRNLDFKQKQKIRGSVQAMEQKGDTWQHPGQDRHEEEFLNWQLKQGDGSTLPQNSSATTYVQIPNVGSGPRIPNASMQHADVDWKDEYQDWQGVPKAGDTASTADAVDIEGEESISVLATPIESIDFKSLETVEGRETIFRQMVAMYNTVRNQRDILGFEGKKNLKNADFDAYASFRKRYLMLRKKIGEFSEHAVTRGADGKAVSTNDPVSITDEEKNEFEKSFSFLKNYYDRAQSFASTASPKNDTQESSGLQPDPEGVRVLTSSASSPEAAKTELKRELLERFDTILEQNDIHQGGNAWYTEHVSHSGANFPELFSYLQFNFDEQKSPFTDKIFFAVKTQVQFQKLVTEIDALLASNETQANVLQEKVDELETCAKQLKEVQQLFVQRSQQSQAGGAERMAAEEVFRDLSTAAAAFAGTENKDVPETKAYEKRAEIRNVWKEKKTAYETAYAQHLEDQKTEKKNRSWKDSVKFWKKSKEPESLTLAKQEYQNARKEYAANLEVALLARAVMTTQTEDVMQKVEGLTAGLANRFVIEAARSRIIIEENALTKGKFQLLADVQKFLANNRSAIKAAGYVTVTGIGLVTGGVAAAVLAFGGKAVQVKAAAVFGAAGATAGAFVGRGISESLIEYKDRRRSSSVKNVRRTFSVESMDQREQELLKRERGFKNAVRNQKTIIKGSAIVGGGLGVLSSGSVDFDALQNIDAATIDPPVIAPAPELPEEMLDKAHPPTPGLDDVFKKDPDFRITPEQSYQYAPDPSAQLEEKIIPSEPQIEAQPPYQQYERDTNAPYEESVTPEEAPSSAGVETPEEFQPRVWAGQGIEPIELPEGAQGVPKNDLFPWETVEESPQPEEVEIPEEIPYTFEYGDKINTVSEALYETWKENHDVIDSNLSNTEFLREMYTALADMEKNPDLYEDMMEQMGVESGDIDDVLAGDTVNLQPFFEYMKTR